MFNPYAFFLRKILECMFHGYETINQEKKKDVNQGKGLQLKKLEKEMPRITTKEQTLRTAF